MKTNLKKLKECKVRMTVEIEAGLVEQRFMEVVREFQKKAQLPGFREGKAPLEMVEKRYAQEAQEEMLKHIIPECYHQAIAAQKDKVVPVSLPTISEINFQRGKPLSFTAEFEREPDMSIKNYKGIKIKKIALEVEGHEVDKGIKSLLEARAELVPVVESRAVREGDLVVTDINIWNEGEYKPGRQGVVLAVEKNPEDDFYEKVLGAKVDEEREIAVDAKPMYKVAVREIKERKLPALDDEFAKIFGKENVAELHEAVRKDIARAKQSESVEKMKTELFQKLLDTYSFELPEALVAKQKERLLEQSRRQAARAGVSEKKFEQEKLKIMEEAEKKAREQVRLYFILQKISEIEAIEIDEAELEKRLELIARESKRPIEEVHRVFEEDVRESMKENKTVDFLLAHANFQDDKS